MFIQLKPREESFLALSKDLKRKFEAIVLCEGETDVKILKAVTEKIGVEAKLSIGVTDCGGIENLKDLAQTISSLMGLSRRLKTLAIIIDMNDRTPGQRVQELMIYLKPLKIREPERLTKKLYRVEISDRILLIHIAGIEELPFRKHVIEDHVVKLLLEKRALEKLDIEGRAMAKSLLKDLGKDPVEVIKDSSLENIKKAFQNLIELIKQVALK